MAEELPPTPIEVEQAVHVLVRFGQLGTRPDPPVITESATPPAPTAKPGRAK